jgi:hypothetical protein
VADQRIEKWTRWIDGTIKNNVLTMHLHRHAWRELASILEQNPGLPESYWWEFMLDTYATTQAAAVRRQADAHTDAASLRNLVEQVRDDAHRLTPEWWIGLWGEDDDAFGRVIAARQWEENFGGEVVRHLDPAMPSADLERLTNASASIKDYVDRHIAHAQSAAVPAAVTLKVADLHAAIDVIGEVYQRYYTLLTASSMLDLVPVIQHDWTAIFRRPWAAGPLS